MILRPSWPLLSNAHTVPRGRSGGEKEWRRWGEIRETSLNTVFIDATPSSIQEIVSPSPPLPLSFSSSPYLLISSSSLKGRSPADLAGLERLGNCWNARKVKSTVAKLVLVVVVAAGLDLLLPSWPLFTYAHTVPRI